jgi:hypothetical protein
LRRRKLDCRTSPDGFARNDVVQLCAGAKIPNSNLLRLLKL